MTIETINKQIDGGFHVMGTIDGKIVYTSKKLRSPNHAGKIAKAWLNRTKKRFQVA